MSDEEPEFSDHAPIEKRIRYKADDTIYQMQEYNLDLKANHIYLVGEESMVDEYGAEPGVEFGMANRFLKNLNALMRKSKAPILVHMKSCGGDWTEGMAIYDTILACPNPITILSYTHARSMSSIIFSAADRRVMMPHSTFMIHGGLHGFEGTHKQFQTEAEQGKLAMEQMLKIYIDTLKTSGSMSKWSRKRIREWLLDNMDKKEEVYFTAEDAVKVGFADMVFGADGIYDWEALQNFD